jgi:DNA-binding sugar fermentation-stimulating protein
MHNMVKISLYNKITMKSYMIEMYPSIRAANVYAPKKIDFMIKNPTDRFYLFVKGMPYN